MPDDSTAPPPPAQSVSFSGRYLVIVGGLLLLIIAMPASLWTRERIRRMDAEKAIVELQQKNEQDKRNIAQMMLGQMARGGGEGPSMQPFQRQDHVPVPVVLDGAKRQAYVLSASGAERFGFQPGDVIMVAAPTNAPSGVTSNPAAGSASEKSASSPAGG